MIADKFLYYVVLADLLYGPVNRIIKTTEWRSLDMTATQEQKRSAELEADRIERNFRLYKETEKALR